MLKEEGMMKKYDAYKDSEVKWIGEIPEHWEITPLKFCFKVLSGATPKSTELSYWEDGNINWITPADFKTEDRFISDGTKKITKEGFMSCSTTLIPSGSIIFSKRAPIGSVVINSNEVCTNQGCLSCIPKDDISSLFFYYIMSVSQKYFDMLGTGTTFNEISANVFKNVHLPVPPLSEQQAIASYLDAKTEKIDQMIAKAEKKIEYFGELKQSVITRAVTRGLNPNMPLKDSGVKWIGDVPEHWEIAPLKYFTHIKTGSTPPTLNQEYYESEDINWFTPGDFESLTLKKSGKMISNKAKDDYACKIFPAGSVYVVGIGATIGKVASCSESASCNQQINVLIPIKDKIDCRYLVYCMNSQKEGILLSANMVTLPIINQTKMGQLPIPIPLYAEQQQIATYLDIKCSKIDYIIAAQKKKIAYLQELKQSLIANVVTGKIKVS